MHRSRTRFVAGLAAAALPLALLAGCGEDEPEPKFEDPTSESPSASSTPDEPEKPTPPAAMEGDDVEGAKAFVEYYFAVMDYAVRSQGTQDLHALATPSCSTCSGVEQIIESTRKNNGRIVGGKHKVAGIQLNEIQGEQAVSLFRGRIRVRTSAQVIRDSGLDGVDGDFPAGLRKYSVVVGRDGGEWKLADWRPL